MASAAVAQTVPPASPSSYTYTPIYIIADRHTHIDWLLATQRHICYNNTTPLVWLQKLPQNWSKEVVTQIFKPLHSILAWVPLIVYFLIIGNKTLRLFYLSTSLTITLDSNPAVDYTKLRYLNTQSVNLMYYNLKRLRQ